jgi:hypothetical protein
VTEHDPGLRHVGRGKRLPKIEPPGPQIVETDDLQTFDLASFVPQHFNAHGPHHSGKSVGRI